MRGVISILTVAVFLSASTAQAAPAGESEMYTQGPRRHLGTIIFAGIAGAALGLSTLSFYGRPQDRLSNIAVGAAIGIIGGALYTTYRAAAEPKEFYGMRQAHAEGWFAMENFRSEDPQLTPSASYTFEF